MFHAARQYSVKFLLICFLCPFTPMSILPFQEDGFRRKLLRDNYSELNLPSDRLWDNWHFQNLELLITLQFGEIWKKWFEGNLLTPFFSVATDTVARKECGPMKIGPWTQAIEVTNICHVRGGFLQVRILLSFGGLQILIAAATVFLFWGITFGLSMTKLVVS